MTFDKEEVLKKLYEELADNEWIIDDPWGPDNIEIPLHELHKRLRTILTQAYEAGRKEERERIKKLFYDGLTEDGKLYGREICEIIDDLKNKLERKDEE